MFAHDMLTEYPEQPSCNGPKDWVIDSDSGQGSYPQIGVLSQMKGI